MSTYMDQSFVFLQTLPYFDMNVNELSLLRVYSVLSLYRICGSKCLKYVMRVFNSSSS